MKNQQPEMNLIGEGTNYGFERNISVLNKSGDWLLPQDALLKVISFYRNSFNNIKYKSKIVNRYSYLSIITRSRCLIIITKN